MNYIIRKTKSEDVDVLMSIYAEAQDFMAVNGNPNQWGHHHPKRALIEQDVVNQVGYAVVHVETTPDGPKEIIDGTFAFILEKDPTYSYIEGKWLNEEPYGTIHRIASRTSAHGIFEAAVAFAKSQTRNIRIDTHADNQPMQHLIHKYGFTYCGIIYVADGTPRVAFQKEIE